MMPQDPEWKALVALLTPLFKENKDAPDRAAILTALEDAPPANIALALEELEPGQAVMIFQALEEKTAAEVLGKLDAERTKDVLEKIAPEKLPELIAPLPAREAASVLTEVPEEQLEHVLDKAKADDVAVEDVQQRVQYKQGAVGRLMTTQFVRLYADMTIGEALQQVRNTDPDIDIPSALYVMRSGTKNPQNENKLAGVISIKDLLMCPPEKTVSDAMTAEPISVKAEMDERDASALLAKYKFSSLPVTDKEGRLLGAVPADELMPILVGRLRKLYSRAVGTDAEHMESLTPLQAAKTRVPWLLGTMVIELGAGAMISYFDAVLQKVILLASFMPVISAISGNVGLQAAAITVRAIDSDTSAKRSLGHAVRKEAATSLFMALACGLVLGGIGAFWSKHIPFGLVIGVALTFSMLTAGMMGTVIPLLSKRFGFDPATTAGPFETAFQDIVGFGIFLGLATALQGWLV